MAEVTRLKHEVLVIEKQPDAVGRIKILGLNLFVGEEIDVGISVTKQRDQFLSHGAGKPAAVKLFEFDRIGKPAHGVTERADRELNQDITILGRIFVAQHRFALLRHLDAKPHEVALGAIDPAAGKFGLK
jgi:hypothetical protein